MQHHRTSPAHLATRARCEKNFYKVQGLSRILLLAALCIVILSAAAGCSRRNARINRPVNPAPATSRTPSKSSASSSPTTTPSSSAPSAPPRSTAGAGQREAGIASWYGEPYHGRRAASGEVFDMEKLTAAHRTLPFNTWVAVLNENNGRMVEVRITDRGPFVAGRIIDLSRAAAREIGMLGSGIAPVEVTVLDSPNLPIQRSASVLAKPFAASEPMRDGVIRVFSVQAGTFADRRRAEMLAMRMVAVFGDARVLLTQNNMWRVLVGRELTGDQAAELAARVTREAEEGLIVPEPY